mmetsp:Transcript_26290/g.44354  ORF Transcript_26290/g.44354 Transcript_26290/m.44354 type:complete len:1053 (-) Transcript_26290:234-3392(-)
MGCSNSKDETPTQNTEVVPPRPAVKRRSNNTGPLTLQEIEQRIDSSADSKVLKFEEFSIKYAYVCQRGYYPDSPNKLNQDAYCIHENFGGESEQAFFGVFDGHGKAGTECSQFIRKELPKVLLNVMQKRKNKTLQENLVAAHLNTNTMLHLDSRIDDSLAGTTSITILFQGRKMAISNVGDSRAIVISRIIKDGKKRLVARALSVDQTPYRKDERDRIKQHGGRVMSMDQIEGIEPLHENWGNITLGEEIDEGGDPPRVWAPNGAYPGTAFTRSFGDMYAEELGVIAEPEVLMREIQAEDLYIVIASDGVFEFMTNQALADIVDRHTDPLHACHHVVEQAYGLWLQYEVRTDDITAVCIFLQDHAHLKKEDEFATGRARGDSVGAELPRPVRRNISREKQKYIIEKASDTNEDSGKCSIMTPQEVKKLMKSLKNPKTQIEKTNILGAISENFLFRHLNETQLHSLVEVIQRVPIVKGDVVIRQGDFGDLFYIAQSGVYDVRVVMPGSKDAPPGTKVHTYRPDDSHHPCFGELALMYDKPRAATIIALEDGVLWALDRNVFKFAVLRTQNIRNVIIKTLRKVKLFQSLNATQIQRLADLMITVDYSDGEYIITQGAKGESFFIIVEGSCAVTLNNKPGAAEKEKHVGKLNDHDYFGERALLSSDPRAANVIAEGRVELLEVKKSVFEEVLGSLASIMEADKQKVAKLAADRKNNAPKEFSDIQLLGFTSIYPQGSIVLGKFNSDVVNVTAKTFLLSNTEEKFLKTNISHSYEALKLILSSSTASNNVFIPRLLSCYREANAFHFVYGRRIVTDIGQIGPLGECQDITDLTVAVPYAGACVINALEALHGLDILYRNVQPESVHIDIVGRICLLDMNMTKIGGVSNMTFTICGDPEYLAPEQITQQGHNGAVDLWALGVFLYVLIDGKNPFGGSGEVATFSKISTFGTSSFPTLTFDDSKFSPAAKDLIGKLVQADPKKRLGVGRLGCTALKEHPYFSEINWKPETFAQMKSPFENLAQLRAEEAAEAGCADDIVFKWKEENKKNQFEWLNAFM